MTTPRPAASRSQGALFLLTAVLAWGLTWPVNKAILESLHPLWAVGLRAAIGTAALFALGAARGHLVVPSRADLPVVLSIALLHMVGFSVLTTVGLLLVPTGRSVVLAYTTPLWVTPGAALFLGERIDARRALGVIIGLLGLAALFNPLALDWTERHAVAGHAAILAGAVLWAGSILHIRGHRWRATPLELVPWESLLATVLLVPLALALAGVPAVTWDPRLGLLLLYAGIPGTALAYWAIAMAGRDLPAATTALGSLGTPVVSIVVATIWLGEAVTVSLVLALVLILGGVALGTAGGPPDRRARRPEPGRDGDRVR